MELKPELQMRDRAMRLVRAVTLGSVFGAGTLTGLFSTAAAMNFSGQPVVQKPAHAVIPVVPDAPAPVQQAPSTAAPAPAFVVQAPAAPAPAPPPPVCMSAPSKPC